MALGGVGGGDGVDDGLGFFVADFCAPVENGGLVMTLETVRGFWWRESLGWVMGWVGGVGGSRSRW